jgi:hypothetical protein
MVRGQISRLIYIDSSVNTHGDRTRVLLPPRSFTATNKEQISLTLQSFSMRRNWYNINPTNNTAFVYDGDSHYEFSITPGVYSTFADLATAVQAALTACIAANTNLGVLVASVTCTYNTQTRLFDITFTKQAGQNAAQPQIRCFAMKGPPPTGLSLQGLFNDLFEILGARPIRNLTEIGNSLQVVAGSPANQTVLQSRYPASLNTLDAIYIHLPTLETSNFMSTGHESHIEDSFRLVESSIFARIPFARSAFDEVHEVVQFEDNGGDAFQSILTRKSLENLDIRVTDAKGRSLASVDPTQSDLGLMAFKMAIRFDLFIPPEPPEPSHGVPVAGSHPPSLTHK